MCACVHMYICIYMYKCIECTGVYIHTPKSYPLLCLKGASDRLVWGGKEMEGACGYEALLAPMNSSATRAPQNDAFLTLKKVKSC